VPLAEREMIYCSAQITNMSESAATFKLFFLRHRCTKPLLRMHYERPERRISLCWEAS
jgi:hypothetical protein